MTTIFAFQAPKHGSDLEEEFRERDTHSIVWSSAHPPLRTAVPELGWVEKGALGRSYAESDYATTAYLCCCGAILGNDLDDVVWIDWFWSDISLRRVWVAQTKLGLTLRNGMGFAACVAAMQAIAKSAKGADRESLTLSACDLVETQRSVKAGSSDREPLKGKSVALEELRFTGDTP